MRTARTAAILNLSLIAAAHVATRETFAAGDEVPKEIIAVQLRKQGFPCTNPESATRSADQKTDDQVWILKCEEARYRVMLVPKQAAKVERLPEDARPTPEPAASGGTTP